MSEVKPETILDLKNGTDAASVTSVTTHEPKAKAKTKEPKTKPKEASKPETIMIDTGRDYDKYFLPEGEEDPSWDPFMREPIPDWAVSGLAEYDWDPTMAATAYRRTDGKVIIHHGKTRWRAVPKANALRKKAGLPPVRAWVRIYDEAPESEEQLTHSMIQNVRLNYHTRRRNVMATAESIARVLSAGVEERKVADAHQMSLEDLHGHLLLLDEEKCPPKIQEMLRDGAISFSAALELARRSEKLTKAAMENAANQIVKVASGGARVTAKQVRQASGATKHSPATLREKKAFVMSLKGATLAGKLGEAAKWAAIVALEVGLGTRTVDDAWEALDKIAKDQTIRVDFKQYAEPEKK